VGELVVDNPLDPYVIPENPFLDNTGSARIHNDGFNTGSYARSGLHGPNVEVLSTYAGDAGSLGVCPTLAGSSHVDPIGAKSGDASPSSKAAPSRSGHGSVPRGVSAAPTRGG
jgi:hypothetical protein